MAARQDPRPAARQSQTEADNDFTLQDEWTKETEQTIDESALRRKPDWLEAIGDEDEDAERIEQNLRDEWEGRGEDDFVSDPTAASESPDWVDDDYDDENEDDNDLDTVEDIL